MRSVNEIINKKTGIFLSGGLASLTLTMYLISKGCIVQAFWADAGQYDEPGIEKIFEMLAGLNVRVTKVDLRKQIAGLGLDMIRYNASYEGGYWNSTGALRYCLVKELSPYFRSAGCEVFTHGCVGGGNDQKRFNRYSQKFMPGLAEFLPWESQEIAMDIKSRKDMSNICSNGPGHFNFSNKISRSTDSCLIGTSYEGTDLEDAGADFTQLKPIMSLMPWDAPGEATSVEVQIKNGMVISIDADRNSSINILEEANKIAGSAGISLKSVFENRINHTKCKGIYESPGMDLLSFAFDSMVHASVQSSALLMYKELSRKIGNAIYEGRYEDPEVQSARMACDELVKDINGEMTIKVYKGNMYCTRLSIHPGNKNTVYQKRFSEGGHIWADRNYM